MACTDNGLVWIADHSDVQIFNADGVFVRDVRDVVGCQSKAFASPHSLTLDEKTQTVFVADNVLGLISVFSTDGTWLKNLVYDECPGGPSSIALDSHGTVYAVDTQLEGRGTSVRRCVVAINSATGDANVWPSHLTKDIDLRLAQITINRNDEVLLLDRTHRIIHVLTRQGQTLRHIKLPSGGKYANDFIARAMAHDRAGNLYVCNEVARRMEIFGPDGTFLRCLGEFLWQHNTRGDFHETGPCCVAIDRDGKIFIGDTRQRVHVFAFPLA